jgi:DNA-binding MarR family transcriptional regulator
MSPQTVEKVYVFIQQYFQEQQAAPTQREIVVACKLRLSTVTHVLDDLEKQGRVERGRMSRRILYREPNERGRTVIW